MSNMARKCSITVSTAVFCFIAISAINKVHAAPSGCDLRRIFQTPNDKERRLMGVVPEDDSQGTPKSFANAQISLRFSDRSSGKPCANNLPQSITPLHHDSPVPHLPQPCQCNPRCHCCNPQPLSVLYAPSHLIHPLVPVPQPQPVVQQQELMPQIGVITNIPPPVVSLPPQQGVMLPSFPQGPTQGICVGCGAPFPCNCMGYIGAGPVQGGMEGPNTYFPQNYQNGGVSGSSMPGSVISGAQIGPQNNKQVGLVNNQAVTNVATNTNTQGWSGPQNSYSFPVYTSDGGSTSGSGSVSGTAIGAQDNKQVGLVNNQVVTNVATNTNTQGWSGPQNIYSSPVYTSDGGLTSGSGSVSGTAIGAQDNSQVGLVNNKAVVNTATSSGSQTSQGSTISGADIGPQDNSQKGLVNNQAIINIGTNSGNNQGTTSQSATIAGNVLAKLKNNVQGKLTNEKIEKKIAELERSRCDMQRKLDTIETSVKKQQDNCNRPTVVVETATLDAKPPCNSNELKINIVKKLEGYPSQTSNIKFIPVELSGTHAPRERTLYKRINPVQQQLLEEAMVPYTPSSPLAPSWDDNQRLLLTYPVFEKGSFVQPLSGSSAAGCRRQVFSSLPSLGETVVYKKSPPPGTMVSVMGPFKGTLTNNPKSRPPTATIVVEEEPSSWREAATVKRPSKIVTVVDEEPIKTPGGSDYVWTLVKGPSERGCSKSGVLEEPFKREIVVPSVATC